MVFTIVQVSERFDNLIVIMYHFSNVIFICTVKQILVSPYYQRVYYKDLNKCCKLICKRMKRLDSFSSEPEFSLF